MSASRVEWRGDVFATDLDAAMRRVRRLPLIPRRYPHTLTVFLHPDDEDEIDLTRVIRLRAYHDLEDISAEAIASLLSAGITGKLQSKSRCGETRALGTVTLKRRRNGRSGSFGVAGHAVRAGSVRVSQRLHYSFAPGAVSPFDAAAEARRVTVDLDRHLFMIDEAGGVRSLGQLGPRLEIKAPTSGIVDALRSELDPEGLIKRQPNRSLELLFQELLRRQVVPAPQGYPEIELKFGLAGGFDDGLIVASLDALGDVRLLLPPPHGIERMRRYHLCRDRLGRDECTVVETASGRLSVKRKRNPRMLGAVLLRDTLASRTTDRTGALASLEAYLGSQSLTHVATFEKAQTKIPFALPDGRAFLISFDHCFGRDARILDQIELEYIGTLDGARPAPVEIARTLEVLGNRLRAAPLGPRLIPDGDSKFGFFSAQMPRLRAS